MRIGVGEMREGGLNNAFQSVRARFMKESKLKAETERHTGVLAVEKNLLSLLNNLEVKQSLMAGLEESSRARTSFVNRLLARQGARNK